jgi:hypothetical protein
MPVVLISAIAFFALTVAFAIGEAACERDWPRETFKWVVIFGLILIGALHL